MAYLHHVLIHFPVALGAVAALFVLLSWLKPAGPWAATARALAYLAALGAIGAAATGLLAAGHVAEMGGDADAVRRHRNIALPAAIALVVAAVVTWGTVRAQSGRAAKVAGGLSILAAVAVAYGAHLGGDMLHPGLAPWSDAEHHHGPGPEGSAMPEAHHGATGGAMPPGHDMGAPPSGEGTPGANPPSAEPMPPGHAMPGAGASAEPSAAAPPVRPRAPSTTIQSSAPNPSSGGAPPSRPVTPGTTPPPASPPAAAPPAPHGDHKH